MPFSDIETQLQHAAGLLAEGRAAEALMAVETMLANRPGDPEALALQGAIMAAIAATDPALVALELSAAIDADHPEPHLELGHAYAALDRPSDAERCFKRALALDPGSAEPHASLGMVYLNVGIDDGAEHHSRRALELDGAHAVASQTLAALLEARGEHEAARAQLDIAYRRQSLFAQPAAAARLKVLVLATVSSGNVPYRLLMPQGFYSRLVWYMEYARQAETPAPDQYDLVFNSIGDADLAEPSAAGVARFLEGCAKPLLNDPDKVMRTRRDRAPGLLGELEDVVVPPTVRLEAEALKARGLAALAREHGFAGPVLVRPAGSHGGQGLQRAAGGDALAAIALPEGLDHYLTEYVDYRSRGGLYRKYRILFVNRQPYPYHQAISEGWLVHHETSGMAGFAERRAEEAAFLEDPEAALGARGMAAIRRVGQALDLDYCGVDFSVLPDGRLLIFEANATMLAHREDPAGPFAYKNPYVERIAQAFQAHMARRAG
jgi:Flp pilus assembly protein TadD/glutathione synthase/RimK-type ligase-like ATP-grasp enzyme